MRKIIWLFATTFLLVEPASARLGETEEECISRYGIPVFVSDLKTGQGHLPRPSLEEDSNAVQWRLPTLKTDEKNQAPTESVVLEPSDKPFRALFSKNGYTIEACFIQGRSFAIFYSKKNYAPLDEVEVQSLLQAESEDREWTGPDIHNGQKSWSRGTKFTAELMFRDSYLGFFNLSPETFTKTKDNLDHERAALRNF